MLDKGAGVAYLGAGWGRGCWLQEQVYRWREGSMTEQEWLACTDPTPMLEFLQNKASDRKLRLFAVACSCRCLHLTADDRVGEALDIAERFADGLVLSTKA